MQTRQSGNTDAPVKTFIDRLPLEGVFSELDATAEGLSSAEAARRFAEQGPNTIATVEGKPVIVRFLANFTHLMAMLLWVGGAIAFAARLPQLGWAVWLVNLINGLFSFWQEYRADKASEALRRLLPVSALVLRDGIEKNIPAAELVTGDLMVLAEGDSISADARLIHAAELRVDQSTLSGESNPVAKTADLPSRTDLARSEMQHLVFAGSTVVAGTGSALVFATGMSTEFGRIAHLTQQVAEQLSPLQKEIRVVTRVVTALAVGIGLIFYAVALLLGMMPPAEGFVFALGMIVAFVPEGLLPTVTLALALGVQRMARRRALVKRLSAVETLGATTVICTDKTGTLTQNEMTVRGLWTTGGGYRVTGTGYAPEGQVLGQDRPVNLKANPNLSRLLIAAALCGNARLVAPSDGGNRWGIIGDPTEAALRVAAAKAGLDAGRLARIMPCIHELPFDSRRKRMSTIHSVDGGRLALVKGAPGEILDRCATLRVKGRVEPLTATWRAKVLSANDAFAGDGLRVLALAERELPEELADIDEESVERDMVFIGLAAMYDPPREDVLEAVERCHSAGIRIVMITGDYGLTAEVIARRVGILRDERPRIVTGADMDALDDTALKTVLTREAIFARVAPEHKLRVVRALQAMGHVVAVTGDGVNDAPALKQADIGVAMGLSGTDVAKEAADIILTDDHFASIVNAVEEGRTVYANIKKFTTYIFTSNTPEAVPFILFALSGGRIPLALTVMQVLAVDLGTDIVPALALGAERAEPGVMERPPRRAGEHVVTWALLRRAYLWLGPVQALAAMAAFYFHYWSEGYWGRWLDLPDSGTIYREATAMALSAVVATQVGNLFAQRTERTSIVETGFFGNRLAWTGIATEILLIVSIVYLPPLQGIFGTSAFPAAHWLFLLAWAPALLFVDELRKWLVRRRERRKGQSHPSRPNRSSTR